MVQRWRLLHLHSFKQLLLLLCHQIQKQKTKKTHVSDVLEDVPAAKVVDLQHQIVDSNLHPINNECESLKNTSDNNSHSGEFTNQYGSEVQKIQENLSSQKIVNVSLCSRIVIVLRRIHI